MGPVGFRRLLAAGWLTKPSGSLTLWIERKRNAGGGVLAVRGNTDTRERCSHAFYEAKLRRKSKYAWLSSMRIDRPVATPDRAQFFKLESLILAQNERWRQA
jgi:hypothetical protein